MQMDCHNLAYSEFIKLYTLAFEQSFPLRDVTKNNNVKREPWFTIGLLVSSRKKSKLFSKKVRHPTEANMRQYKQYNNMFNQTKRQCKFYTIKQY